MPVCLECGNQFTSRAVVDGVYRQVGYRKKCLDCYPYEQASSSKQLTGKKKVSEVEIATAKKLASQRINNRQLPVYVKADKDQFHVNAHLAIEYAAEEFDKTKAAWQTFAYRAVSFSIMETLREVHHLPRSLMDKTKGNTEARKLLTPISLDTKVHISDGGRSTVQDFIKDPSLTTEELVLGKLDNEEMRASLMEAMTCLTKKELGVINGIFFEEKPYAEIAEDLGMPTAGAVSAVKVNAIKKLKRKLEHVYAN